MNEHGDNLTSCLRLPPVRTECWAKAQLPDDNAAYYETAEAVSHFAARYAPAKERAFCRFLLRFIPAGCPVLEIGGGSGLHGSEISRRTSYTHSDQSSAMCAAARARGLHSVQIDALALPDISDFGCVFAIELSTLRSNDRDLRRCQMSAIAKAMRPGGKLLMSTAKPPFWSRDELHTIDAADRAFLTTLGFRVAPVARWGMVPGFLWRGGLMPAARGIEKVCTRISLGVRHITLAARL